MIGKQTTFRCHQTMLKKPIVGCGITYEIYLQNDQTSYTLNKNKPYILKIYTSTYNLDSKQQLFALIIK